MPWPPNSGVAKRVFHIGNILQNIGKVTVVIVSQWPIDDTFVIYNKKHFDKVVVMQANIAPSRTILSKIYRMTGKRWIAGRHHVIDKKQQTQFLKIAQQHDLVWFHTLKTADLTGIYNFDKSVIDFDDIISEKLKQQSQIAEKYIDRIHLKWQSIMWRKWEQDAKNRFKVACICSDSDKIYLKAYPQVYAIPNGYEFPESKPSRNSHGFLRLGFIGKLTYFPNQDGIRWFLKYVFPLICQRVPEVKLRIIGELPSNNMIPNHPNVNILGFQEEVDDEISSWSASLVPLRIGGGTRIKILEAFSKMCPVVSTSLGAYGLNVEKEKHLLIGDTPKDFADACIRILLNPTIGQILSKAAWELFVENYTWSRIQGTVENVVHNTIN